MREVGVPANSREMKRERQRRWAYHARCRTAECPSGFSTCPSAAEAGTSAREGAHRSRHHHGHAAAGLWRCPATAGPGSAASHRRTAAIIHSAAKAPGSPRAWCHASLTSRLPQAKSVACKIEVSKFRPQIRHRHIPAGGGSRLHNSIRNLTKEHIHRTGYLSLGVWRRPVVESGAVSRGFPVESTAAL